MENKKGISSTQFYKHCPAAVKIVPWEERLNSLTPRRDSKTLICFITAVWDTYKSSAAFEKLPVSATALKVSKE